MFKLAPAACAALVALAALPAAEAARFNDTGLTHCFDTNGSGGILPPLPECSGTGQDAGIGRDATQYADKDGNAGFKFARICHSGEQAGSGACPEVPAQGSGRNDWGCTLDRITGLMWELKTNDGGPHDKSRSFQVTDPDDSHREYAGDFVAQTNAEGFCGATDWRLPSIDELVSIVDYGAVYDEPHHPPRIDKRFFPETMPRGDRWGFYWADPGTDPKPTYNSGVYFGDTGYVAVQRRLQAVRMVRATRPIPPRMVTLSTDGTEVSDPMTGLVWQRCPAGSTWNGAACAGTPMRTDWPAALQHAAQQGNGWRLPNVKELVSLVTLYQLKPEIFPLAQPEKHIWSSTGDYHGASGIFSVHVAILRAIGAGSPASSSWTTRDFGTDSLDWDDSAGTWLVRDGS